MTKSVQLGLPNNAARAANPSIYPNAGAYGTTGPLKVSFSSWANTFGSFAKLALAELGLKELPDFVSGNLYGYQYSSQTIDSTTQTRSSSETSYLRWAMSSNSQLQVYKSTLAKRILFDSDKRATGVLVNTAGAQYSILAQKEVILSAGAHRSPQLLLVSGIGPQDTVQNFGIPVLPNLAGVGQNLWFMAQQIEAYRTSRTGYLTNPGSDFLAWENLPTDLLNTLSNKTRNDLATQFPKDWPTLQHTFADAYYGPGYDMLIGAPTDGRQYVSILPTLVATFSRGNITINSTDTSDNPIISPNMLSDPRDQEIAVAAFKRARQMFTTKSLKRILTGPESYSGIDVASDADILSHIMKTTCPIWHASSSCKMGTSNDSMAVVDSQARVFGVTGLRVVDSSAFPFLIPGHPQATHLESGEITNRSFNVDALAEKIADAILHPRR
ncbi:choline dehydrogenase protein [Rutstroemia sp. NJR-2017a BVV2]|nr:choline dehydrogenase protein [Rutstroemia sp. NJR-2017a BVV2]